MGGMGGCGCALGPCVPSPTYVEFHKSTRNLWILGFLEVSLVWFLEFPEFPLPFRVLLVCSTGP